MCHPCPSALSLWAHQFQDKSWISRAAAFPLHPSWGLAEDHRAACRNFEQNEVMGWVCSLGFGVPPPTLTRDPVANVMKYIKYLLLIGLSLPKLVSGGAGWALQSWDSRREAGWVDGGEFAFWLLGHSYSCLTELLSLKNDVPSTLSHWAGCLFVSL